MKHIVYLGNILEIAKCLKSMSGTTLVACIYEDSEDLEAMRLFEKREGVRAIRVRSAEELDVVLQELEPDLGVVANFGIILSESNLARAGKGFVNVHPGLLPNNKGRNPVQRVFKEKLSETGVTLHFMTVKVDEGPVIAESRLSTASYKHPDDLLRELYRLAMPLLRHHLPVLL